MSTRYRYLMHKTTNDVGVADLPDWVNFDEKPPRSFEMWSYKYGRMVNASTSGYIEITKEEAFHGVEIARKFKDFVLSKLKLKRTSAAVMGAPSEKCARGFK